MSAALIAVRSHRERLERIEAQLEEYRVEWRIKMNGVEEKLNICREYGNLPGIFTYTRSLSHYYWLMDMPLARIPIKMCFKARIFDRSRYYYKMYENDENVVFPEGRIEWMCDKCAVSFNDNSEFIAHKCIICTCKKCNRSFNNNNEFVTHVCTRKSTPRLKLTCPFTINNGHVFGLINR